MLFCGKYNMLWEYIWVFFNLVLEGRDMVYFKKIICKLVLEIVIIGREKEVREKEKIEYFR